MSFSSVQPVTLKLKILNIQKYATTPYIHCSKLNSTLLALKNALNPICAYVDTKNSFDSKENEAAHNILRQLDDFQALLKQCPKESCLTFLVSSPIHAMRSEIQHFRQSVKKSLEDLTLYSAAQFMGISDSELQSQDTVDLKRIAAILSKVMPNDKQEVAKKIEKRLESLNEVGIQVDYEEKASLTIPEIPESLKLVISHDSVVINVKEEIGHGQSGFVYKGNFVNDPSTTLAIKVLNKSSLTNAELMSYRREVYALTVLSHPSLLKFMGYTEDAPFYICTEYMSGGSVFHKLHSTPEVLTPTIRSLIAYEVARGLEYLHSKGVIHRDLKSLNILLDKDLHAKICDFGMARTRGNIPMTGMMGTVHWMAPEVLLSAPFYDEKVDVYSFGIFLWELLTGETPYSKMPQSQIITLVTQRNERPPLPPDTPPKLRTLINKCWSADPEERPHMMRVVIDLLDPECHFRGTDETDFELNTGIINRHRPSRSLPNATPLSIIELVSNTRGEDRTAALRTLLEMCQTHQLNDLINKGLCITFAQIINERSNDSRLIISFLLTCRNPNVFDIDVLKALLNYSDEKMDDMRQEALSVLLSASIIRFDFLKSAPSFTRLLLNFTLSKMPPQSVAALLQLANRLINSMNTAPPGLWPILIWDKSNLPHMLTPLVVQCMICVLKHKNARDELTTQDFVNLMKTFRENSLFLTRIINFPDLYLKFTKALCQSLNNPDAYNYLITQSSKEFVMCIIMCLPLNIEIEKAVPIYKMIFSVDTKHLSKHSEFYEVLEYLLLHGEYSIASDVIVKCHVNEKLFIASKLPTILATEFQNADEKKAIKLMAAIFIILSAFNVEELTALNDKYLIPLFGKKVEARKPAFLCSIASGKYIKDYDFSILLPIAAFFIHSSNEIVAQQSLFLIQQHIMDQNVNVERTLEVFRENYKKPTKFNKAAASIIKKQFGRCPNQVIINELKQIVQIFQ